MRRFFLFLSLVFVLPLNATIIPTGERITWDPGVRGGYKATSDTYTKSGSTLASSTNEGPGLCVIGNASADYVTGVQIYNNTFYGLHNTSSLWFGHLDSTVVSDNNLWYGCTNTPGFSDGSHNPVDGGHQVKNTGTIAFASAATGDFHLTTGATSAIDHGASESSIFTTDFDGTARPQGSAWDIGAYEYVPPAPATAGRRAAQGGTQPGVGL
ncbi:MAG TPA: choice-of-anchor Q domain-containing protein [Terracidiphilus sp.]|nr:choice-of-anchor Q domain-containing protein [Terracidiphilus sp.]